MSEISLLIPIAVFFAVILSCVAIFLFIQQKKTQKDQAVRIKQAVNIEASGYVEPEAAGGQNYAEASVRRDTRISSIKWLDTLLSKILKNKSKGLMILIEQTGLRIKVSEFILFTIIIGLLGIATVDMFFHIPLVGGVVVIVPFWLLHFLKAKRVDAFVKQLSQALDLLSSDLRAGLDIQAGVKHLSEEFVPPLGEEFAKVVVEVNLGLTLTQALNNLSTRVNTIDVQMLCTGIIINRELGGNLSELIQSIATTVRERFRLKGMIKALTAENEMSAMLLIALPIGLFILLNVMAPDIYNSFLKDPVGRMILGGCAVSMTMGFLMMKKLTKVEV